MGSYHKHCSVPALILLTTFPMNVDKATWGVLMAAIRVIFGYIIVGSNNQSHIPMSKKMFGCLLFCFFL